MAAVYGHDFPAYDTNPANQRHGMQHQHAAQHASSHHLRTSERPKSPSHRYLPSSFISAPRTSGPDSTLPPSRQTPLHQSGVRPTPPRASASAVGLSQKSESYAPRDAYDRPRRLAASSDRAQFDARAILAKQPDIPPAADRLPPVSQRSVKRRRILVVAIKLGHNHISVPKWARLLEVIDHRFQTDE